MASEEANVALQAPAKGPAKGPGKGPSKGPPKGKGKSPAAEQAAPVVEEPKAAPEPSPETSAPETSEAKAEAVAEVKESAEAPAVVAKGPGKGPSKGPPKGKGKSPAAEQAAPAAEDPPSAEAPEAKPETKETGEAKADAVEEVKETAEAPAVAAKGPGKGPAKGPSKGKGKSPAAEQAAPAAEDPPSAEAPEAKPETKETDEAKADAVEEVKETAEAPAVAAKGPGKGPAKGPSKGKGKSPAAEQAAPAAEEAASAEAPETFVQSVQSQGTKGVTFEESAKEVPVAVPAVSRAPADHLNGAAVDINVSHVNGELLKRGPVFGYAFQPRWCILTNTQLIVYKDERFSQRQSAERLSCDAKAARFSGHDAPGEAVKHKSEKPCGFVLDSNPMAGKGRKLSYFDAENEEKIAIWLEAIAKVVARRKEAVTLHVYDMAAAGSIEGETKPLGTGHFHVGIEINGSEWSYGFNELGSGVFECKPTHCEPHSYRDAVELGYTSLRENEISEKISKLKDEWPGCRYDVLKKNCCSFCKSFCEALGATLPPWILRLASAEGAQGANDKARKSAIIMAAQAVIP